MSFDDMRLRVFNSVATHLSLTRAAEELSLTQPAITFQIRQLEEHFNTRLFDRHHNRIALTDAGLLVLDYAERIIDLYRETEKVIHVLTGTTRGRLSIGATTTPGEYILPQAICGYHERFPGVQVRLIVQNTASVVRKLEDATIDLGIVEGPVQHDDMLVVPCMEDELVLILAPDHPLARMDAVPVRLLKDYPFISREEESGTRTVIAEQLGRLGVGYEELNRIVEMGATESIKSMVAAGVGFSFVSLYALRKELNLAHLVVRRLREGVLKRPFYRVLKKRKIHSKAVEELLIHLEGSLSIICNHRHERSLP